MIKVAVNRCYGGFNLSAEAHRLYAEKKGKTLSFYTTVYHENGDITYRRANDSDESFDMFTTDLGETLEGLPNDQEIYWYPNLDDRSEPDLIETIEQLGVEKASGECSKLEIVEIPDDVENNWHIAEYDGWEHVAENHRTW